MTYVYLDHIIVCTFLYVTLLAGYLLSKGSKTIEEYVVANKTYGVIPLVVTYLVTHVGSGSVLSDAAAVFNGESFLEAAIRESKEESGGVYQLEPNDLLNNGVVCYNEHKQKDGRIREEVYILLKINDYYPADVLRRAVNQQNKDAYREKDDFKWVACTSLCTVEHNPYILKDIDGNECTFTLRTFFYKALKRDSFRMKLQSIM